ncbi:hypothetical protein L9F63_022996 [Diploptera punctata]|uniref:Uncharacterized protein n=1 Tax=Diploptera punctata TaxID=6984 RepID=A0AAD8EAG8_DIPPU|nr:hypothetical protein L9F63_022996 [Diploptera punctata]
MIGDSQEEVGDSLQGTSTLLQIGNIVSDSIHSTHKGHQNSDNTGINGIKETDKSSPSSQSDVLDKTEAKIAIQQINEQQNESSIGKRERKTESSNSLSSDSKKHSTNITNFTEKQWQSDMQQSDKVNVKSKSVGTQSQIVDNFILKSTEVTSSQNCLLPSMQPCSSMTASTYISVDSNKGAISQSFANQMKQGTSSNQISSACKSRHQQIHPLRNAYQTNPTFDNTLTQGENSKKLANTSVTFCNSVTQPEESSCLKSQTSITSQHNRTQANILQPFNANKKTQQNYQDIMTQDQISGNSIGNHPQNQYSFSKISSSQIMNETGTMTEEIRNVSSNYKLLPTTSSSVSGVTKHTFSNNAISNSVPTSENSNKVSSYNCMSSNSVPEQPYSCNLFNDCSTVPSQITCSTLYTQASNPNDQIKTTGASSFSVAHNSSNFSILSWTTLSPMSAPTNSGQYDSFHMPLQNSSTNISHHTTALQKTLPQIDGGVSMPVLPTNDIQEIDNCQKQCKNDRNVRKTSSERICKLSGNFNGLYNDDQRSLGMPLQDVNTSHMHFQGTGNDNQTTGSPEGEGGNDENFKYPISSTNSNKNHQSARASHSIERIKSGHHHRPPVNWMTSPDIRTSTSTVSSESTSNTTLGQSVVSTPVSSINSQSSTAQLNKDFDFCNTSNSNIFVNSFKHEPYNI